MNEREGHPLECPTHAARVAFACPECLACAPVPNEKRLRFLEEARKLVGTPFSWRGRSPGGVDCVGLPALAARNSGIRIVDSTEYDDHPNLAEILERLGRAADVERAEGLELLEKRIVPGDLLVFVYKTRGHAGILDLDGSIIHTSTARGRTLRHSMSFSLAQRVRAIVRIRGIDV